jgi:hypothetical protein
VVKPKGKRLKGSRWKDNIKTDLTDTGLSDVDYFNLVQDRNLIEVTK